MMNAYATSIHVRVVATHPAAHIDPVTKTTRDDDARQYDYDDEYSECNQT